MSAIVNARDVLLQGAPVRNTNPRAGKSLQLNVSSLQFKVAAGVAAPAAIAIEAVLNGLTGAPTFAVTGASKLIGSAGLTRTLSYADVTDDAVQITAELNSDGQTYKATQTIIRVKDGNDGQPGAAGLSNATVYAFKRSAVAPTDGPGDVVYSFTAGAIVSPVGDLGNGWFKEIPAGNSPVYVRAASASGSGATVTVGAGRFSGAVQLFKDGADGVNGLNSVTVSIYQRSDSATPPALPSQQVTYTFATAAVSGLDRG
ncbi:hypothetical protein, partial [Undibacterium squillarum]|uniref:hypothetical protein n=1 Tax=Undibacterium squillarum TaxID=1131567 RepID=UPI00167550EE